RPQQGGRPPYQGQRPQQGGRPPFRGGGARPQGGGFMPEVNKEDLNKKHAGKKFFKAKKRPSYQKNKKESKEIDFNVKKKQVIMANPVPKSIDILEAVSVSELAKKMNLKASELIGKLMTMGMMVNINQQIDAETAEIIAAEYDCKVNVVSLYDETIIEKEKSSEDELVPRPPIVTVMGHVDHGKTKLLDAIRETDIVSKEHGGITQHIGAYKVSLPNGEIVFLDTPGHEAFTLMRARGAQITDIVVLVVAANDGVMPQTVEAIHHAKEAEVPILVVINKIDLPEANPDRVKQQLSEYDLIPEDWGGSTLFCNVSALKKEGITELLDVLLLQAEMLELKANPKLRAEGKVIESKIDHGRGIVSSIIIQNGTLRVGDAFVAGIFNGKVRALFDDHGNRIEEAPPGTPVEVLGFTGVPDAGSPFQVTKSEKLAKQIGEKRQELERQGEAKNLKKITLDNIYDSIQEGEVLELKVIIKGDVHGSVEALKSSLEKLSTKEVRLNVIHAAAGAIIENDINLAAASNAIIIGFHVRPTAKAQSLAEKEKVDVRKYNIIYDVVEDVKSAMEGLLAPDLQEMNIGTVEVREIFKVPKIGVIAGCYVTKGKVKRGSSMHIFREGVEIHTGKISSLKRFKDDAKEVAEGYECGIGIENFDDLQVGDIFEVFEVKEIARKL
ncbi:MAG: translation initiation factor IF-2, partial [Spirochaetes bacterium]